jgi:PKD repeat protein
MDLMSRFPLWRLGLAFFAVTLCTAGEALAQARPFLFSMGRFTAAWAGRPRSYDQQIWDHMVVIGATATGTGLAWCDAEPIEGQYNWDPIDYADFCVNEIRARGMEVTFFVGLTPQWAKLYPNLEPHRTPPREDCVTQFMNFHRFVANRYKGRVKYYCFWNEPNGCSWINGCSNSDSYPLYTKWLIRCSQAIKGEDPDARIVAANLDYNSGVTQGYRYVQGMYDNGAGPYFDVISIHPYDGGGTIYWQALTDTRNVMVAHGDANKPIWVTEYGWNTTNYQSTADKLVQVLTELKKPQWSFVELANYLVLNDGSGVENYGLTDANLNPRAGYYAFRDFDKTFPPGVDFTASVSSGVAPLTVQFTDQSNVPGASSWYWEFGDGQTSAARNPSHTYTGAGTYSVRLTVTGTPGTLSAQKDGFILVTPGSVEFSAVPTAGPAPLAVQFTDHSTVSGVSAWLWEFGDGGTSTLQNPSHTYTLEGSFAVRLTVTNGQGQPTAEKQGLIHVGNLPSVAFLAEAAPLNAADTQIVDRLRSFGLLVDVYDDDRANRPAASEIAAGHNLVIASSTVLSANVAGDFRHESVPFIFWESSLARNDREALGDGAYAAGSQTQVNVLNNTHPIMEGVPTGIVTLGDGPEMFSYCTQGTATGVTVLATSTSNSSYRTILVAEPGAALLDGGTAAGKRIMLHLYDTTWEKANATGQRIFTNAVAYALGKPTADFTASATSGRAPMTISFSDQSTGAVTSWAWDFGDGSTSSQRNPAHTYQAAGAHSVTLTVGGPGGPNSLVRTDYIAIIGQAAADFDGDGDVDQADFGHLQACFTGMGLGPPAAGCDKADLDGDTDVDELDIQRLAGCFGGPNVTPDPACEQR